MHLKLTVLGIAALSFLLLSCNGTSTGSGSSDGPFTAKIDGKPWAAMEAGITAVANAGVQGTIIISGNDGAKQGSRSITLSIYNVRGPGKYALGVGIDVIGGIGQTGESIGSGGQANSWITPNTGNAGEVEITELGGGRIAGTFFFTADTGRNNSTRVPRTVSDGRFDLALTGTPATLPENKGSKVTAKLGEYAYNAWSVYGFSTDYTGGPGIRISTTSSLHGLEIHLQGVTDTGTFTLTNIPPIRTITSGHNGGNADFCCWQTQSGDEGEIKVTALIRDGSGKMQRVKGTYKASIKPTAGKPATSALVITEGTFDVGITL